MSEIITRSKPGGRKIHNTRVDLTPMVDLGFLLITFFVFTTTMSQPRAMALVVPDDNTNDSNTVCATCALTVLLDKDNIVHYYEGDLSSSTKVYTTGYGSDGIRRILIEKRKLVKSALGNPGRMTLIIKASENATMQNFVDMMDEVSINDIKMYYVAALTANDKKELVK